MANINLGKVALSAAGIHTTTESYEKLDIVNYQGGSYIAKKNVPTGITIENNEYWQLLAAKGETGTSIGDVIIASTTQPYQEENKLWIREESDEEYTVLTTNDIDDNASEGDDDVVWSADKSWNEVNILQDQINDVYCKNLYGGVANKLYPCNLPVDGYLTMSTSDGEITGPSTLNLTLYLYDGNKSRLAMIGFNNYVTRTIQNTYNTTVKYFKFNKNLDNGRKIQIEYGNEATSFRDYFPNACYLSESEYGKGLQTLEQIYCKNLYGGVANFLYPCDFPLNSYLTMSTSDGETTGPATMNLTLSLYDENKNLLNNWSFNNYVTRTIQNTYGNAKYLKFNKNLDNNRKIQVERGEVATSFQEYFPNFNNLSGSEYGVTLQKINNSWNSTLHEGMIDYVTTAKKFSALMSGDSVNSVDAVTNCEGFVFFTDPHTMFSSKIIRHEEYLGQIQKMYRSIPASFILSGGDWLVEGDTPEEASYKLGLIGATCRSMFDKCYLLVGNHDTNNQGKKDSESNNNTTRLPINSIRNLWYNGNNTYYSFDGKQTKFYCFDTETGTDGLNAFAYIQAKWFANSILSDTGHIALALHMYYVANENWCALTHLIMQIAAKYNTRGSITVDGVTFDYSSATGFVEFTIVGHTHVDDTYRFTEYNADIPVIVTKDCGSGFSHPVDCAFDLVFVDYDNRQIKCIRVGSGSDRTISLATL